MKRLGSWLKTHAQTHWSDAESKRLTWWLVVGGAVDEQGAASKARTKERNSEIRYRLTLRCPCRLRWWCRVDER